MRECPCNDPNCPDNRRAWELGPRPSVDPLVALIDVLVWICCGLFAGAVAVSYLIAVVQ